jgi:MATE family multidrug resistance protein
MGTYSLTGVSVISVIFLLSSIIMWNASSILIALGQPVAVSYFSGDFIRYLMIGVPFQCLYELIQKVSQSRNEARPMLISTLLCNIVNAGLGYYLVNCTAWGWLGAAVAHSVGEVIKVPSVLLCMVFGLGDSGIENERGDFSDDTSDVSYKSNPQDMQSWRVPTAIGDENVNEDDNEDDEDDVEFLHHIWEGFVPREALSPAAIIEFLRIGIPGMLQVMFEWVAFEVIALLCGILPGQEAIVGIGANSIIMNVSSITYTLYQGVAVSGNVRVGNALGAGEAHRAEVASKLTFACGAILSCINVAFLLTFRHGIPWIFTSDPDIIEQAKTLLLITTAFQFSDAFNACVQGVFRGSGRQALAAKYNFVAFYIIGIPLGYTLGVREGYGVEGLWLGITAGLFSIAIGGTTVVMQSDWKKLASEANSRLSRVN